MILLPSMNTTAPLLHTNSPKSSPLFLVESTVIVGFEFISPPAIPRFLSSYQPTVLFISVQLSTSYVATDLASPHTQDVSVPQLIHTPILNFVFKVNFHTHHLSFTQPLVLLPFLLSGSDKQTFAHSPITLLHPNAPPLPIILVYYTYHQNLIHMAQQTNGELHLTLPSGGDAFGNDTLLVGLIVSDRIMHPPSAIGMLNRAWAAIGTFAIEPFGDRRTYAIMAPTAAAADRVLSNGPWCINGAVLSLHRWPRAQRIDQLPLHLSPSGSKSMVFLHSR